MIKTGLVVVSERRKICFPNAWQGFPLHSGGAGVELFSPDVAQPSATARNRPREDHMGVPMLSSAKGVTFRAFQRRIASFRVAGVALRDIPTCFMTCQKWFCVAGAILLPRFQKMRCIFRGRHSTLKTSQHFEDLPCHFAWQA